MTIKPFFPQFLFRTLIATAVLGAAVLLAQLPIPNGVSGGSQQFTTASVANAGTTGTTVNLLAKIDSSGNAVTVTAGNNDMAWIVASGAGTTGSAALVTSGLATCRADASGITRGHVVINSAATDGRCADSGGTNWANVIIAGNNNTPLGVATTTFAANGLGTVLR